MSIFKWNSFSNLISILFRNEESQRIPSCFNFICFSNFSFFFNLIFLLFSSNFDNFGVMAWFNCSLINLGLYLINSKIHLCSIQKTTNSQTLFLFHSQFRNNQFNLSSINKLLFSFWLIYRSGNPRKFSFLSSLGADYILLLIWVLILSYYLNARYVFEKMSL